MNLNDNKYINNDDNLEFESLSTQIPIAHNVFPTLRHNTQFRTGFVELNSLQINSSPLIPVNIEQLIGDETEDLNYPSETTPEDLYQYTQKNYPNQKTATTQSNKYVSPQQGDLMPQDILREFDLNLEINDSFLKRGCSPEKIDAVFSYIEENDNAILGTLNSYRAPYPISKAMIKKIINITLEYVDKEW